MLEHDPLLLMAEDLNDEVIADFVAAIEAHRNPAREPALIAP